MVRVRLAVLAAVFVVSGWHDSPAAEPAPAVSLLLTAAAAERGERDVRFRCEVKIDNALGRDLGVRSNFGSVFDGLELVVTTADGKVVAQQGYTSHQSPSSPLGRAFPLRQGKSDGTLVFPVSGLSADARALKVRLVGTLPGSGHDRILSSETLTVTVKDRPRK